MVRVKMITAGELSTNCYILIDDETNSACIIDPADDAQRIYETIKKNGFKAEKIVLTHCHFDHFLAAEKLKELLGGIPIIIPKDDAVLAGNSVYNLSASMMFSHKTLKYDETVEDGDEISFGNLKMRVISTPGHTPGGCCYYFEKDGLLISGDTLFALSIGRSDFPLSNGAQLNESIKTKLFTLPEDTYVCPGHGPQTTIRNEKHGNPYIY